MIKLEYNNKLFDILDNYSFKKSSREVTFNPVTVDFTGKSINDLPCKYQECRIWDLLSYNEEKNKTYQGKELNFNLPVSKIVNVTEFKIDGKSVQKTTTGKNLLNYIDNLILSGNGLTNTLNSDGSITTSGKPTKNYATITNSYSIYNMLEDKQTYTISQEKANHNFYVQITAIKADGNTYYNSSGGKSSFALDKSLYTNCYIGIQTQKMSDWGDSSLTMTNKFMFCKGTDNVATNGFEAYTGGQASPNPDYPQEIDSVSGIENLANINDIQIGKQWSGLDNVNRASIINIPVKPKTTYTLVGDISSNSHLTTLRCVQYATIGAIAQLGVVSGTFTTGSDVNYVSVEILADTTITSDMLKDVKVQLEQGSIAHNYVSYGHWLIVTNTGKNLCEITSLTGYEYSYGLPAKVNTNFAITEFDSNNFSYSVTSNPYLLGLTNTFELKPNTDYTLSFTRTDTGISSGRCYIYNVSNDGTYTINQRYDGTGSLSKTFTTGDTGLIALGIGVGNNSSGGSGTVSNIMIEQNTEPTEYKPYQSTSSFVDMNKYDSDGNINGYYELSSIGDIKDELNIDKDGNVSITQNIGEVVLDGNSNDWIMKSVTNGNFFQLPINNIKLLSSSALKGTLLCNYFPTSTPDSVWSVNENGITNLNDAGYIRIRFKDNPYTTLNSFKAWLSTHPVTVKYVLAEPKIIELNKCTILLHDGVNNISLNSTLDTNLTLSTHQDFLLNGSILYTGYVNSTKLPNMKNERENRYLELELLSPMALATRRTITTVGTYKLQELISLIIRPLITDGFTLKEMNIGNNTVTVNYLVETVESTLNKLSNKFNFWWYIDENKQITINDITYQFQKTPIQVWNDKNKFEKLISVTPSIEAVDYCNVIDFTNVRVYQYSYCGTFTHKIYDDSGEVIKSTTYNLDKDKLFDVTKTIKKDDTITFNFPIDIKPKNIIKSLNANSEEILSELNYYAFSMSYKKADGTNGTIYIKTDSNGTPVTYSNNVSLSESDNEKEFVFSRDSFFNNLLTGFKYNGTSNIISISQLFSCSALIWTRLKINDGEEIQRVKGHISESGQVEKIVDMNEQWKTFTELQEIASSYINASSNQADTIELEVDKKNGYEVGDIISIDKPGFLLKGNYMVTDLEKTSNGREYNRQVLTLRNSDYLTSYIDLFRASDEQTSDDKVYNLITINYNENRIKEVHEVV